MTLKILAYKRVVNPCRAEHSADDKAIIAGGDVFPKVRLRAGFRLEHWAWLFLFLNLIRFMPRGYDITGLDPHSTYRILMVFIAAVLLMGVVLVRGRTLSYLFKPPLLFMLMLGCMGVASSLYSSVPFYTMWKGLEILALALVTASILSSSKPHKNVEILYKFTLLLLFMVVVTPWIWLMLSPSDVMRPVNGLLPFMLQGKIPPLNPNTVGALAAITGVAMTAGYYRGGGKKILYVLGVLFAVLTLILSSSRTSFIGFLVAIMTFAYFDKQRKLLVGLIVVIALVIALGVLREFMVEYLQRGQSIGSLSTLSGRTVGWTKAWEYFKESPYIGHGLAAAGRFDVLKGASSHLHGSVFDLLIGVGLVGTIPWLLLFLWTGVRLFHPPGVSIARLSPELRTKRAELLALYVYLIIRATTTSQLAAHNMEMMLFMCLTSFGMLSWQPEKPTRTPEG